MMDIEKLEMQNKGVRTALLVTGSRPAVTERVGNSLLALITPSSASPCRAMAPNSHGRGADQRELQDS